MLEVIIMAKKKSVKKSSSSKPAKVPVSYKKMAEKGIEIALYALLAMHSYVLSDSLVVGLSSAGLLKAALNGMKHHAKQNGYADLFDCGLKLLKLRK